MTISKEIDQFTAVVDKKIVPVFRVLAIACVVEAVLLLVVVVLCAVIAERVKR